VPRDAVVGVVILALAGIYWLAAGTIRRSSLEDAIGAAGVPNVLAALLAGLAILLILRSVLAKPTAKTQTAAEAPTAHWRALGMLVLGILYLVVVPWLGYAVSVALLIAAVALYNHQKPGLRLAGFAVLLAVGFYLLFVQLLNIPLPAGIWPGLVSA
jgi:hypothetical protein